MATTGTLRAGIYHRAGYIGEADTPETTYNGVSLFYLLEAYNVAGHLAEWDFLEEVELVN